MLSRPPPRLAASTSLLTRGPQVPRADQDVPDLVVGDHRRETVAAEQEDVAVAGGEGHRVDVHARLRPQGAGDDRALRVLLSLLLGEPPLAAQLLDQRVVLGQALELAVAEQIGAAVADVAERDLVVAQHRRRQRGPHAGSGGVLLGELVDLAVRLLGDLLQLPLRGGVVVARAALEGAGGDPGGDLAGLRAAHAVGHGEQRRPGEVGVLVGVPLAPGVGLVCLLGDVQHQDTSKRNSVSPIRITSPGVSSASPCSSRELRSVPLVEFMSSTKYAPERLKTRAWIPEA